MWLPKDEGKLLRYYYHQINKVEAAQNFEIRDIIKAFGKKERSGPPQAKMQIILDTYTRLEDVNNLLSQRNLIKWENLSPDSIRVLQALPKTSEALSWPENTNVNLCITLTIKGYDSGRKYSSRWTHSGLWFAEYRDHWFGLILSFLGGIVGALIVNWLSK